MLTPSGRRLVIIVLISATVGALLGMILLALCGYRMVCDLFSGLPDTIADCPCVIETISPDGALTVNRYVQNGCVVVGPYTAYLGGLGPMTSQEKHTLDTFCSQHLYMDYVSAAKNGDGSLSILYLDKVSNQNRSLEEDIRALLAGEIAGRNTQ